MYKMKAIKNDNLIIKGFKYCLGEIIYGTNNAYIMDERGKDIIPGKYDLVSVFGTTRKEVMKNLNGDSKY